MFYSIQALPELILRSNGSFVNLDTHDCMLEISSAKTDYYAEKLMTWKYRVNEPLFIRYV